VSTTRRAKSKAKTPAPKPQQPKQEPTRPIEPPSTSLAKPPKSEPGLLDRTSLYFSIFGGIVVVASLVSHILLLITLIGVTYIFILVVIAIRDKSIGWPAWRVIIALVLAGVSVFLYYAPPRTESFTINLAGWQGWTFGKHSLSYFPVTANPQVGDEYQQTELDPSQIYNDVNARCWTTGNIAGYPGAKVIWVSIKGGNFDGLWVPYEAFNFGSPGLADDIPNCDSWWFKVFPFL
jgi:hypothetical protein